LEAFLRKNHTAVNTAPKFKVKIPMLREVYIIPSGSLTMKEQRKNGAIQSIFVN